ncbi:30S ribosomal protein S4 [Candidatus Kaiserbacteria bacterium]|nr:30S ribosomal protein S4 [Candidatus Kaiserbacteria bacterium]MCB9811835.1 30S ribosomal protein S4 [Candidatus Nomurabacteria bacterium]
MKIGPKFKIAKRLGAPIFEKTQTQKFALSEARGGRRTNRRPGAMSDFKRQLIEKQKMRFTYGISEKQLRKYIDLSTEKSDQPISHLIKLLEMRLDNTVYRLGLAKTRQMARQMVSHGHVTVNGKKFTIPSHQVRKGDVISVREGSKSSLLFSNLAESYEAAGVPGWLTFDIKKMSGSVTGTPSYEPSETLFDPEQVLEYYSR